MLTDKKDVVAIENYAFELTPVAKDETGGS